ncbi:MAG: hypothetical protein ACR2PJ_00450 [Pseudomonadales bacterium]
MLRIGNFFWQLCLLRRSPADLPATNFATGATLLVHLAIYVTIASYARPSVSFAQMSVIITGSLLAQVLTTWCLLRFKGLGGRFRATWTALLGCYAVLMLLLMPLSLMLAHSSNELLLLMVEPVAWVNLVWWLAVAGYIYHKAAGVSILQGAVIAFLIEYASFSIADIFFPTDA